MSTNKRAKSENVLQANGSTKISSYFSMGYNFKCHKNTFLRVNYTSTCLKIKKMSVQTVLGSSPWPVFLECKQLRDAASPP